MNGIIFKQLLEADSLNQRISKTLKFNKNIDTIAASASASDGGDGIISSCSASGGIKRKKCIGDHE